MSGYKPQNYTQSPNELFDKQMAEMSNAELRVTLAVIRLSFGYHRQGKFFRYSLSDMRAMTGLSTNGIKAGIKAAKKRGTIEYKREDGRVGQWRSVVDEAVSASDTALYQPVTQRVSASDTPSIKENLKKKYLEHRLQKPSSPNGEDKPPPILAVLESHFSAVTSIPIPERDEHGKVKQAAAANKRWWTPLRYIANLVGGDEGRAKQLITDAVNQMRSNDKPLTISAPQSIEQVAISIFSKNGGAVTVTKTKDGGFYA